MEEMPLSALFEQARKIHLSASESRADQDVVKKGCEMLDKCEDMIGKLGLFSSNETKEDISTNNLKYLLVPYYLADKQHLTSIVFLATEQNTMSTETEERRRVSCTKCFDALWFCYSPFYQMQQYYRVGKLDDCTKKFSDLFDCLSLKTKTASEAKKIMIKQEKADAVKHIWVMRTQEEASSHWNVTFGHLDDPNC